MDGFVTLAEKYGGVYCGVEGNMIMLMFKRHDQADSFFALLQDLRWGKVIFRGDDGVFRILL